MAIEKGARLCRSVVKEGCILHIPASFYPKETPKHGVETGWWYTPVEEVRCKRCKGCDEVQAQDAFDFGEWRKAKGSRCKECEVQQERPRKKVRREGSRKIERQTVRLHYEEKEEDTEELDEMGKFQEEARVRCEASDPRYIGRADDRDRGDVVLGR